MDEKDKQSLEESSKGLMIFDDDITEFRCVQCGSVAISRFTSNCNHVFCRECQAKHVDDVYSKCPRCQAAVTTMCPNDSTFEEKSLNLNCPNMNNGSSLKEMPGHLKQCKHPAMTQSAYDSDIKQMSEQIKMLTSVVTSLSNTVQDIQNKKPRKKTPKKKKESPPSDTREQQQQQPQTNGHQANQKPVDHRQTDPKQNQQNVSNSQRKNRRRRTKNQSPQMTSGSPATTSKGDQLSLNDQSYNGIPQREYNMILLGQTGVGKSTFINAFANYLTYACLDDAFTSDLAALIPCQFSISDENYTQRTIKFGQDANENMGSGAQSSTQSCRAYRFPVHDFFVRLIDTPGIGDTRGIEQDRINLEEIFTFITNYDELHAICILLKPNESKLTTTFQFCITQLLCQLHENASKNIIFVFTNCRNTFYRPGDTTAPLKAILGRIKDTPPYVDIPFHKGNTFCLDSEAFRFLVAVKNEIQFANDDCNNFCISWNKSVEECHRMIRYMVEGPDGRGLAPHSTEDTTSICEARRAIVDLSKPLADNAKLLQDNIQVLNQRLQEIQECKGDVAKLKTNLYIPVITLDVTELTSPRTVCRGDGCRQVYKVGSLDKYHYPKKCHDPCYLKDVPVDIVGPEQLRHCHAMNKQTAMCDVCGCHYSKHIHIYYESTVVEAKEVDQNIQWKLTNKSSIMTAASNTVEVLKTKIKEYEDVRDILTKYTAKLAVFLQKNALVARNDAFEEYLKEQLENEKSLNGQGSKNDQAIERLMVLLRQYNLEKDIIEKALQGSSPNAQLTTKEVKEVIKQLQDMKLFGETMKKMLHAQQKTKSQEIAQREMPVTRFGKSLSNFTKYLPKQIRFN